MIRFDFLGQPIAEKDQNGNWTDYINAGGKKIARVTQKYPRLDLQGTGCGANAEQDWNYVVGTIPVGLGDRMVWREKHLNSQPSYLKVQFSNNVWIFDGATADENGLWQTASIDLSPWAGDVLWATWVAEIADGNGAINSEITDLEFVKADGTVYQPLWTASSFGCSTSSVVNENATDDVAANPQQVTHFYVGDHLGTAQLEFAAGGWPVWQGQFAPFGGELDTQTTANNYKFTGKERDPESGLDYFGARYYASNMGRWMSPDWSAKEDPVPYAKLDNPQSLNLYGYVLNNPLGMADPDGHCCLEEAAQLLDEYGPSAVSATQTAFTATVGAIVALALKASGALDKVADAVAANPGSIQSGSWDVGQSYNHPEQRAENLGSGNAPANTASPAGQTGSPTGPQKPPSNEGPKLTSNPKHHQNSASPEPKNAKDLFKNSVADNKGVRWAKDENGVIHRFSAPRNGESHWNGSTAGKNGIKMDNIPNAIRKALQ